MEVLYIGSSVLTWLASGYAFYKYARYDERMKWEIAKVRAEEKKITDEFQIKCEELVKEKDNLIYDWQLFCEQLQQDLEVSTDAQIGLRQKSYMIYNLVYFLHFTLGCIISPDGYEIYQYNQNTGHYDIKVGKVDKDPSKLVFFESHSNLKKQYQNYLKQIGN